MSNDPHDLLAAYALDALDDDERERFERHLADCEECTDQLAMLREPVAALAYAAEGPVPRNELRDRIIEGAHAEPRAAVIKLPRRNWALGAVAGVAAAAAVLAIGLGLWANSLSNSLDRERNLSRSSKKRILEEERDHQTADRRQRVADRRQDGPGRPFSSAGWPGRRARRPMRPG